MGTLRVSANAFRRNLSELMTARDHFQRPVPGRSLIEMNTDSDHLLEQGHRWLHMNDAIFYRPRTVAGGQHFFANRYREILMPRYRPVLIRGFIEKNTSNGNETSAHQVHDAIREREARKQIGSPIEVSHTDRAGLFRDAIRLGPELSDLVRRKDATNDLKSRLREERHPKITSLSPKARVYPDPEDCSCRGARFWWQWQGCSPR